MSESRPLGEDFVHSSALNAACALVHRWLAHAERGSCDPTAHADLFVPGATVLAPTSDFAATYRTMRAAGRGSLALEFGMSNGRLVAEHLDDENGGRLTRATFEPGDPQCEVTRSDAWTRNRALAFAHRWLWAWERETVDDFDELLAAPPLDITLGAATRARSKKDFYAAKRSLDAGSRNAHHVLRAFGCEANGDRFVASAEIDWRGQSAGGTHLRARTRQTWTLHETGGRYPLLQQMSMGAVHPLEPDLFDPSETPELANAPSDDAESGGA